MSPIIAVVDDDADIRDAVQLLLEGYGCVVRAYRTGEEFLMDITNRIPDCLILDAHLPGISGAEVAEKIVSNDPAIPIIGLTARPDSEIALRISQLATGILLTKPVSADVLMEQILAAIEIT